MPSYVVPFTDVSARYSRFRVEFHRALDHVLDHGQLILGPDLKDFEKKVAEFSGVKHAIGVGNGTDALVLSLRAMGIGHGDHVITSPMSYLASTSAIHLAGATPVFSDIGEDLNLEPEAVRKTLTPQTKGILVVHLAGIPAPIEKLAEIANEHGLVLIEDCAQAFGATINQKHVGSFGDFGCVSFHPLKNLGALGDAGLILSNDEPAMNWLRQARNHGHRGRDDCDFWSQNTRLDTLQAAFLNIMINFLSDEIDRRRSQVNLYKNVLGDCVRYPLVTSCSKPTYNFFMVLTEQRDALANHLLSKGIETKVHYPIPIHRLRASLPEDMVLSDLTNTCEKTEQILSLPIGPHLSTDQIHYVSDCILSFMSC